MDQEILGGSDDDSIMYNERNQGKGVLPEDHNESEWDVDYETNIKEVRKRRCRKHPGEYARYVCKDHDGEILCPKCLVGHKVC